MDVAQGLDHKVGGNQDCIGGNARGSNHHVIRNQLENFILGQAWWRIGDDEVVD